MYRAHHEEELRVEGPALHVAVEVGEVGVFVVRLEEGRQFELLAEPLHEARLSGAHVSGDGDVSGRHDAAGVPRSDGRARVRYRVTQRWSMLGPPSDEGMTRV